MATVNIVTSDRGWILERLAQEIARRLPYVTFGEGPDPSAAMQYYMTYSCRLRRLSPVELAYFAHLEPEGEAHDRFFAVAREVEHCICHAKLYEGVLRDAGIAEVSTISPGVDLETFRPKLRIGVVGRTYHTGRKGEALVAQLQDIPEIEWSFTGEGWPGPALHLPSEAMPDYYRSLDYVLVPALYEGGPMCVTEALACGTEVIAPAIGWVPEFPHVEYEVGNVEDLRRVLLGLVERKRELRAAVADRTWEGWAEGHDRVFRALAAKHGMELAPPVAAPRRAPRPRRVGLFLHGNESKSQGGPTVRVPRLARELRESGVEAEMRLHPAPRGFEGLDLVHVFNSWSPRSSLDLLRRAHRSGLPVVFSPIFLDHGRRELWDGRLPRIFAEAPPGRTDPGALAAFAAALRARRADPTPAPEVLPGFHASVREMASLADRMVFLSERERARLARIGVPVETGRVVHNPVDPRLFGEADPALFRAEVGLADFVLCVARIEARKNQLMLIEALRGTRLPLVLVGHTANQGYRELVERHRFPGLHIIDRLPPNSPLLASAFAAARVAVLPSWSEGAPLAALEAAAAGASLVISDESGESEYFGARARYCDPGDVASIRSAVLEAWESRRDAGAIAAQKAFIAETYGWERHRARTEEVYAEALESAASRAAARRSSAAAPTAQRRLRIVFDVTTSAHHAGRWTGIARVEAALAIALHADPKAECRFITWNNKARGFVEVPFEAIRAGKLARLVAHYDAAPLPPLSLPEGAHYIVPGSAWMQNQVYAECLVALARRHRLRLTPIIHDIIPTKFPFWFDDGYAPVFEQNLAQLLGNAEHVVAISEATRRDVEAFAARTHDLFLPGISVMREGDEIQQIAEAGDEAALARVTQQFANRPFVLTVGAIHQRKNHKLLYDVWLKLAERMGPRCPHLVLVGGVAWNGQDVARALKGDPRLAQHVSVLEGVDDRALDWLYRHCLFTVYPSLYEGWGLPVAESLRYGKLCIATNASSVPEIAPGLVELIDPLDVAAWATKVQFYAASRSARAVAEQRIAEGYRGRSWGEAAAQLIGLLGASEAEDRPARPYTLGAVVDLADRVAASRIRGTGWHPLEKWGCWVSAGTAELLFEPALPVEEPLVLVLQARALSFPDTPFEVSVGANGVPLTAWRLRQSSMQVLHAVIPAEVARRERVIRVGLESGFLTPIRQVTKSNDPRMVGIGVAKAALAPLASVADVGRYFGEPLPTPQRLALGQCYPLMTEKEGHAFLAGKWSPRAGWGMVSTEFRPRLEFNLQEMPGRDVVLELRLRPVATAAEPLLLLAVANGEEAGAWSFDSDEPRVVRIALSAAVRARGEPVTIDLVAADLRAPKTLGLGSAEDAFGFGLIAITARAEGVADRRPRIPLPLGSRLPLGTATASPAERAALAALGPDWHPLETRATWSFGREAALPLRLSGAGQSGAAPGLLLRAMVEGYRPAPGRSETRIEALVGGTVVAARALPRRHGCVFDIPVPAGACGPGGELDLVLRVEAARSPFVAGGGEDERPLGFRVSWIEAAPMPLLEDGRLVRFGLAAGRDRPAPEAAALLGDGWFAAEPEGCWSHGPAGTLSVMRPAAAAAEWRLFVLARSLGARPGAPAVVEIELDGAPLDRWEMPNDAFQVAEIRGLARQLPPGGLASVTFRRAEPATPRDLGLGEDERLLGVMIAAAIALPAWADGAEAAAVFVEAGLGAHAQLPETPEPRPRLRAPALAEVLPAHAPAAAPPGPLVPRSRVLDFSQDGRLTGVGLIGWYDPEPEGRWSRAELAEIRLQRPTEPCTRLRLELLGRVYGTATTGPATLELRLNGQAVPPLAFANDEVARRSLEVEAAGLMDETGELCISLHRPGAVSPAETGDGDDGRRLGIMLQSLSVIWS